MSAAVEATAPAVLRESKTDPISLGAILLALAVAAPIVALLWLAFAPSAGEQGSLDHLFGTVMPRYTLATAHLALVVVAIVVALGVSTGWLVAAYEFPGRAWLAWLLVLPLSTPAFVMAYAYTDFLATWGPLQSGLRALTGLEVGEYWFPAIHSPNGAGLFLGLALYPYVYLLSRAAFADRSPSLAEAARSLGSSRAAVWWRVTWPVARPAVAAGTALALMETLADFGTVSYFAVDSYTAGIYRAWQGMGDRVGAARLALILLVFVGALMWTERRSRSRMRFHARAARPAPRVPLRGWRAWRATLWCLLPPLLGFLLPALLLAQSWLADGAQVDPRLGGWILNTTLLAAAGAATVLPLALFAAYAARLGGGRVLRLGVALANSGYAVPGVVLGVGLLILSGQIDRLLAPLTSALGMEAVLAGGSVFAVVYAYSVRFFSVGWQGIDSSLKRISPSMDHSARSLGRRPVEVLREVHWPLMRRGLASAALLVFIDCLKELPATLVLRPFDFDTLAVVAYQFASDERLAAAALPSLLIVAVGLAPVVFLSRVASSETKR
ncbi:ABC transporter permease [Zeimonas arvi]|uniref:Iron ABC transporter permease n=1 Tax=Zeimonas arvi TaxID=2498847 RepID=A0A5C8P0A1_9BURK|nr:iron ABC transporter permease [Zeimonas arvi]TXL67015.1 iron ABC transporter permease [Zeimonas arvi]